MEGLKDNSLIYPPGYNELTKQRAIAELQTVQDAEIQISQLDDQRISFTERIARPADETARDLGRIVVQGLTGGILQPTYDIDTRKDESPTATPEHTIALLGSISLHDYMLRDTTPTVVTEEAIVGSAHLRQVA